MKILKYLLFGLLAIIGLALIIALFVQKDYHIEKEVTIAAPKQEVYDYVKFLKNQNNYSKWAKMDPNMKTSFTGTDGTVGFVSAWESEADSVGAGEQEIVAIEEGARIDYEIRFIEPFKSKAKAYMTTTAMDSASTKVTWAFDSHMPYPMNLMGLFFNMEEAVGNDLNTGLQNLKGILETAN